MKPQNSPIPSASSITHEWPGHMGTDMAATSGPTLRATFTASAESLDLKGTLGTFHIPRAAVTRVGRAGLYPWIFSGLRVRHTRPDISRGIFFYPVDVHTRDVLDALKSLGYSVI